jgi:hypothetical protein
MDTVIEFNDAAFNHDVSVADILQAFDTAKYDGWFNERAKQDQYLLIGFGRKGNPPCCLKKKSSRKRSASKE